MNITIIIPAIQPLQRRQSESPQPTTTPFPSITISPTPTPIYSISNSIISRSTMNTSTLTQYCPECNSSLGNNHSEETEISILREDQNLQRSHPNPDFQLYRQVSSHEPNRYHSKETEISIQKDENFHNQNPDSELEREDLPQEVRSHHVEDEGVETLRENKNFSDENVLRSAFVLDNEYSEEECSHNSSIRENEILRSLLDYEHDESITSSQQTKESDDQIPERDLKNDENFNDEETRSHQSIESHLSRRRHELEHQKSFDSCFTESPSSPETVIHVGEADTSYSYDDDFEEESEESLPNPEIPSYYVTSTILENESENNERSATTREQEEFETYATASSSKRKSWADCSKGFNSTEILPTQHHRKVKSGKKPKRLSYPDPRRPSNYPQRLNKVTLARQALAREKRRVYVEERIQTYIQHSHQNHHNAKTKKNRKGRATLGSPSQRQTSASVPIYANLKDPQPITTAEPLSELQMKKMMNMTQSLPNLDSNNYYISHPSLLEELTHTSIPVARVHTRKSTVKSPQPSSATSLPLPRILFRENGQRHFLPPPTSIIETDEESSTEFWNNGMEHGYFYSFRVRESGPVQMFDKSVQTIHTEFSHGYTLEFREQKSPLRKCSSEQAIHNTVQKNHEPDPRDKILRDITETVQLRHDAELRRAELVQRANDLQSRVKEKREKINRRHEFWHKKYIEESALTRPMEASCNTLRAELNTVHRRLLAHLEGRDLPLRLRDGPSKKANYKIMAARLQHEIKELQQKVKSAKLRLESEIKLKEQADRETRDIRNDLSHKKVVMTLARSQAATLPVVHPKSLSYDTLIPRAYDPIHARSYESLYHSRAYDQLLGY